MSGYVWLWFAQCPVRQTKNEFHLSVSSHEVCMSKCICTIQCVLTWYGLFVCLLACLFVYFAIAIASLCSLPLLVNKVVYIYIHVNIYVNKLMQYYASITILIDQRKIFFYKKTVCFCCSNAVLRSVFIFTCDFDFPMCIVYFHGVSAILT